jgi:Glycosyltransferase like family
MHSSGITVVAAVNSRSVLQNNLLRSPALAVESKVQLIVKEGFVSAAAAYNSAIDEAAHDVIAFVHQDIYLPETWFAQCRQSIDALEQRNSRWGVLGCFGSHRNAFGGVGRVYTTGLGVHGNVIGEPTAVETLDEIALIIRKSSGLRFDDSLPHFHMYGVDICLLARSMGLGCYAIPATCVHNTNQLIDLPAEFVECYRYIKRKWASALPISASCITVSRFDRELHQRSLRRWIDKATGLNVKPLQRVQDPRPLMNELVARRP